MMTAVDGVKKAEEKGGGVGGSMLNPAFSFVNTSALWYYSVDARLMRCYVRRGMNG